MVRVAIPGTDLHSSDCPARSDPASGVRLIASMNPLLEAVAVELFGIVLWTILFPVALVLVTPVILATAALQRENYLSAVRRLYAGVAGFWRRQGCSFPF